VWHRDKEDSAVKVLQSSNWLFQLENKLPCKLGDGDEINNYKEELLAQSF
tara:strand:- start:309 stop:458 length:150 start_codon:yes stop_codon:yes gene_type:complete